MGEIDLSKSVAYVEQDEGLIKYDIFKHNKREFRGTRPKWKEDYGICLGSAHTFGRYVETPYPELLQKNLGMQVVNYAIPSATSLCYLSKDTIMDTINGAKFVVIQMLSARTSFNSETCYMGGNRLVRTFDGHEKKISCMQYWRDRLENDDPAKLYNLISESRASYVKQFSSLLKNIKPKKILFWFSVRKPNHTLSKKNKGYGEFYGQFPQLVNKDMVNTIRSYADCYVELASKKGLPTKFIDEEGDSIDMEYSFRKKFAPKDPLANKTKSENSYYPSPEMHVQASDLLIPVCDRILKK
jgi:hypothetical protein